jgi:hypothetical protein
MNLAGFTTQSLWNVEYGLLLRLEGCARRGQPTDTVATKLAAVRAELQRRREQVAA